MYGGIEMKKNLIILSMLTLPISANANLLTINTDTFASVMRSFGDKAGSAAQVALTDLVTNNGKGIQPRTVWSICSEGGVDIATDEGKTECGDIFLKLIAGIPQAEQNDQTREKLDYLDSKPTLLAVKESMAPSIDTTNIASAPEITSIDTLEFELSAQQRAIDSLEDDYKEQQEQAEEQRKADEIAAYYATPEGQLELLSQEEKNIKKQIKEAEKKAEEQRKADEKAAKAAKDQAEKEAKAAKKKAEEEAEAAKEQAEKEAELKEEIERNKKYLQHLKDGGESKSNFQLWREERQADREERQADRTARREDRKANKEAKKIAAEEEKNTQLQQKITAKTVELEELRQKLLNITSDEPLAINTEN